MSSRVVHPGLRIGSALVLREERRDYWALRCACGEEYEREVGVLRSALRRGCNSACDACVTDLRFEALERRRFRMASHRRIEAVHRFRSHLEAWSRIYPPLQTMPVDMRDFEYVRDDSARARAALRGALVTELLMSWLP